MSKPKTIMIDNVKYVREDSVNNKAVEIDGLECVIVRSYGAGVFYGYLKEKKSELNGVNITLVNSKRIYYWDGACSLTQLAMEGTKASGNCKISDAISSHFIANVIELLPLTEAAKNNLDEVKLWKK